MFIQNYKKWPVNLFLNLIFYVYSKMFCFFFSPIIFWLSAIILLDYLIKSIQLQPLYISSSEL